MMKSCFVAAAVASAAWSSAAFAADLPARTAPPAPPPVVAAPVFTWTGFYIGLNAGVAIGNSYSPTFVAGGLFPTPASNLVPGSSAGGTAFTGGLQAGYNWQMNQFVFGLETDINWRDGAGNLNGVYATNPAGYGAAYPSYTLSGFDSDRWYGTLRGRIGYAFDRALIYATGGLAYGETGGGSVTVNGAGAFPNVPFSGGGKDWRTGWALGGGIEYAMWDNWTARLEYLHVDLGRTTQTFTGGGGGALNYTVRHDNTDDIIRVGLNYKFGGPVGSVLARY
jgi:outer membrane immunogenic protein